MEFERLAFGVRDFALRRRVDVELRQVEGNLLYVVEGRLAPWS